MAGNSSFRFDAFDLVHPPQVVAAFIARLTAGLHPITYVKGAEKRSQPRYILSIPVDVQPLDTMFDLHGDVFQVQTRDISTTGIGLIHSQAADTKFLALRLAHPDGEQLQTVVEVLWSRPRGRLFDIGGSYLTKSNSAGSSDCCQDTHGVA